MTDHTREALIEIIGGEGVWPDRVPFVADAILASDWLAAHVAKAAAEHDPAAWMQVALNERAALRRVEIERDEARAENERLTRSRDNVLEAAERDRAEMRAEIKQVREERDFERQQCARLARIADGYLAQLGAIAALVEELSPAMPIMADAMRTILADSAGATAKHEQEVRADGASLIAAERARQIDEEGWTAGHDSEHADDSLIQAALSYAMPAKDRGNKVVARLPRASGRWGHADTTEVPVWWPWAGVFWKPTPRDRARELVKAGALIAAEIDRIAARADALTEGQAS